MTTSVSIQQIKPISNQTLVKTQAQPTAAPTQNQDYNNLLSQYMQTKAIMNISLVNKSTQVKDATQASAISYKNDLKPMFKNNEAKILAIIPRTFNAVDKDGNDIVELNLGEDIGTFNNAIKRLDEVKANGFNTLHVLPIFTTGKEKAKGTAGSLYATENYLELDPMLDDKND